MRNIRFELDKNDLVVHYEVEREIWNTGGYTEWAKEEFKIPITQLDKLKKLLNLELEKHVNSLKKDLIEKAHEEKKELEERLKQLNQLIG